MLLTKSSLDDTQPSQAQLTCEDIDECETAPCTSASKPFCENTIGSFICSKLIYFKTQVKIEMFEHFTSQII